MGLLGTRERAPASKGGQTKKSQEPEETRDGKISRLISSKEWSSNKQAVQYLFSIITHFESRESRAAKRSDQEILSTILALFGSAMAMAMAGMGNGAHIWLK